ncbi:sarcosine oxidase subunit gamma [Primorskyibacter flagellatus]|uniref:Sarcosine oxidase subunit gamma n=1 Tax=Primorskyibacter flagellatus TaxID=1387277 RepID=A0A1W1Z8X5_9RHOB|nr:sarcosine oxidase subunit gamma family protein [Primorskyibacter flagellatus]SMC44388.1 sarcosine oxidase subunit gamma [Primorskyibacter flagellatus]
MSEPISALRRARYEGFVTVEEAGLQGMVQIRGDFDSDIFTRAVSDAAGVPMPGQRKALWEGRQGLLWMSPDEVMLLCPYPEADRALARLDSALAGTHHLALNVSDARTLFTLEGTGLREVLAKLAPVDMSPDVFRPGMLRRTRLAQVAAAFWLRSDTRAEVICFRSVAPYMMDLLSTAAATGSEVGLHGD